MRTRTPTPSPSTPASRACCASPARVSERASECSLRPSNPSPSPNLQTSPQPTPSNPFPSPNPPSNPLKTLLKPKHRPPVHQDRRLPARAAAADRLCRGLQGLQGLLPAGGVHEHRGGAPVGGHAQARARAGWAGRGRGGERGAAGRAAEGGGSACRRAATPAPCSPRCTLKPPPPKTFNPSLSPLNPSLPPNPHNETPSPQKQKSKTKIKKQAGTWSAATLTPPTAWPAWA